MTDYSLPSRLPRRRRAGLWLGVVLLVLLLVAGMAVMAVSGRSIPVPAWVVDRLEGRANAMLTGRGSIGLGGLDLLVDAEWVPRLRLRDVELFDSAGQSVALLPDVRLSMSRPALMRGEFVPESLRISGARLTLSRSATGEVGLVLADPGINAPPKLTARVDPVASAEGLAGIIAAIDRAFAVPMLAGLQRIEADDLTLTLQDARVGRSWQVTDGQIKLTQTARSITIDVAMALPGSRAAPAQANLSFTLLKGSRAAQFGASLRDVAAGDLASQSAALAWLQLLDAPISGEVRADIDGSGQIGVLSGALDIGAGDLRPAGVTRPVPIDHGRLAFRFDPRTGRVIFSETTVESRSLRLRAAGHADLGDFAAGLPRSLVVQVQLSDVAVDPAGLFQEPVRFSQGAVDLRLRLDPFGLTIGQVVLLEQGRRIEARGEIGASAAGWEVALDLKLDSIAHDRLLALWPVTLVPPTRAWLADNVQTGQLFDVQAALRLRPGNAPRLSLGYEFSGADVRFLKTLPPIRDATGYATVQGNSFSLVVDRGRLTAPAGGDIDVAGTVFRVPDITIKPAPAVISLRTESTITAALSLLNEPPFKVLAKANQPVDIARGHATLQAEIDLTLADKLATGDVHYALTGVLSDLESLQLVPGRSVAARRMDLRASPDGIEISGAATLDELPFQTTWSQSFSPLSAGNSRIEATVELSQRFVDTFGIGLPAGLVRGTGVGQLRVDLVRGQPPAFTLQSDLNRLDLRIPAIGWTKPRGKTGRLSVTGTLGTPPRIEALDVSGPGLSASGTVTLNANGSLDEARFSRVEVGDWLDGPVRLIGQGRNRPVAVSMAGGRIDLRRAAFGGGGSGDAGPMTLRLDKLVISQGIALTDFIGEFSARGGFSGRFTGLVNGQTPVSGAVAPQRGLSAVRITSKNAGAVFRAAGVFDRGKGGDMDLILNPTGTPGHYNGRLTIKNAQVADAPALAALLQAISVIGLLEQLNGDGLTFSDIEASFRLTPEAVEISRAFAVGPSMGVTMAGLYRLGDKKMNMQGVISPIYLLNGIGSVLTRKGEGLFGFNYTLRGGADDPQVQVNPLSLLTPGMFRELFRQAPPTMAGQGN